MSLPIATIASAGAIALAMITLPTPFSQAAQHEGMMGGMHHMGSMPGMSHSAAPSGDDSAASLAFQGANAKMHRDMAIVFTGDADVDFVRGMIPHHQGAIDMAKIVLAFGEDPEIRQLAEAIIRAQESEIARMQDWLAKKSRQ